MSEKLITRERPKPVDQLVNHAIRLHEEFDRSWRQNPRAQISIDETIIAPSYHPEDHIAAVLDATDAVFKAKKQGIDPFELDRELAKWNEDKEAGMRVDLDDLEFAARIHFACHDLGNLTERAELNPQGDLFFTDKYLEKDAEERSRDIATALIDWHFAQAPQEELQRMERIKPLVRHLIMQTVFNPKIATSEEPFWQFVQVVDQIGPYYFGTRSNEQQVAGLSNEWRGRGETPPQNLEEWLSFAIARLQLLTGEKEGEVLKIFDPSSRIRSTIAASPERVRAFMGGINRPVSYLDDIPRLWQMKAI